MRNIYSNPVILYSYNDIIQILGYSKVRILQMDCYRITYRLMILLDKKKKTIHKPTNNPHKPYGKIN